MPPRGPTLPNAVTESAREARKAFFCELCQKGYARMNDFEAHEGSYDHSHRKRLKEMKQLTRDPSAAAKAKAAEQRANQEAGISSVNLPLNSGSAQPGGTGTTKKKPVFRSIVQSNAAATLAPPQTSETLGSALGSGGAPSSMALGAGILSGGLNPRDPRTANEENDPSGAVRNGWYEERYDPRFITGCGEECLACQGRSGEVCL